MLSFSTEFPISAEHGVGDFFGAIRSWILGSPHTKFITKDLAQIPENEEWQIRKGNETLEVLSVSLGNNTSAGIRLKNVDGDLEWETTVVFSRQDADAWVGVRTSRESAQPAIRLPPAKKPIVVRTLLGALGGAADGELSVSNKPLILNNDDIGLAGRLIMGVAGCRLPVVYVSCGFSGDYIINFERLANDLSGMAHVVIEPNRPFSRRLQIEVQSENVYGGTIGVYWPDGAGRRSFFLGPEYEHPSELARAIIEEIRTALMNRRPLVRCTWASVQEAASRKIINTLKASGSNEVERYVQAFDSELKAKDSKLKDAETEIARLSAEIRKYEAKAVVGTGIVLRTGIERDLYAGEMASIVRDAIKDAAARVQSDGRRAHVLQAILESFPAEETVGAQREAIKELLRGYRNLDKKTRKGLEDMGFSIQEDGKHYKLVYHGDDRYTFALPRSGSDHRGGLNTASDIAKRIF